jgi:polar amino acid transport system substrate-binding protein
MKFCTCVLVGVFSLMTTMARAETLVVFGDEAYAPIIYLVEGKPKGILPAIFNRLEALTGDKYELQLSPWKRCYELALRGAGGITNISYNEERAKLFDFSKPIYDDDIQIVTLASRTFTYNKLADLTGKLIGGLKDAAYGDEVDKAIAAGLFTMDRDYSQTGRLLKLLAGRQDAVFVGNGQIGFDIIINSSDDLRKNRDKFAVLSAPLTRDPLHLAFLKSLNKRAALERFDAALAKLKKGGEFAEITAAATR